MLTAGGTAYLGGQLGDALGGGNASLASADAAQLAGQGLSSGQIAGTIGQGYGSSTLGQLASASMNTGIPISVLAAGGMGALGAALNNKNPLTGGAVSGLASLFGGSVGKATGSQFAGKLANSGASFGLNALMNKKGQTAGENVIRSLPSVLQAMGNTRAPAQGEDKQEPIKQIAQRQTIQDLYRRKFMNV
jgi:hypothetical protein